MIETTLRNLIEERLSESDLSDCFLIDIVIHAKHRIEVFIDSDDAVTFEKCRKISRHVEAYLDDDGPLGARYTLEVSSAGLDRPLVSKRQYHKNLGRRIAIETVAGQQIAGTLEVVDEDAVEVVSKHDKTPKAWTVDFNDIKKAKIQVQF